MSDYYKAEHLPKFSSVAEGQPELARKFFDYYGDVFADGALSVREKALIALAVTIRGGASLVHGVQMLEHADRASM